MKTGIRVYARKGVPKYVSSAVRDFCQKVKDVVRIEHFIPVSIVPSPAVTWNGVAAFALFVSHADRIRCAICIAGDTRYMAEELDITPKEFVPYILADVAHELAHYETWRDKGTTTERGVRVRSRNILRKACPWLGDTVDLYV